MKAVVAIDSFKGCLSSAEANRAAAEGIRRVCGDAEVVQVAVSDGGEGFVEAFRRATGGREVSVTVADPLLRPVAATYLLSGQTAVIEIAKASGLTLLASHERNPMTHHRRTRRKCHERCRNGYAPRSRRHLCPTRQVERHSRAGGNKVHHSHRCEQSAVWRKRFRQCLWSAEGSHALHDKAT